MSEAMPIRPTAILYARVSTDDKDQDPMTQIRNMRAFCEREDFEIVGEYIEEKSAKDLDRPQFQQVLGRIMTSKVNYLIAWSESRLSRDTDDMGRIVNICKSAGTLIRYVSSSVSPEQSAGKVINYLNTWQSEEERKKLSLNTKQGMATAKGKGIHCGRMLAFCFTHRVAEKEKLIQTEGEHCTVIMSLDDVMELSKQGYSVRRVSRDFAHVSYKTLMKALKEEGKLDEFRSNVETYRNGGNQGGSESRVSPTVESSESRGGSNE